MSRSPVVIEVTRGPVVESRHEGIAAVVKQQFEVGRQVLAHGMMPIWTRSPRAKRRRC